MGRRKRTGGTERGAGRVAAIVDALRGPASPVGDPRPLPVEALRALEEQAGVAFSPAMAAALQVDRGLFEELGWFDADGGLASVPTLALMNEHAGPGIGDLFEDLCARRLPARALPLDRGCDSMRFLYLGDPDEHGEYPVLCVDVDDMPLVTTEHPGFDAWLAARLELGEPDEADLEATNVRLFGTPEPWELGINEGEPIDPIPGPPPGSVAHPVVAAAPDKPLSARQLGLALAENARHGRIGRLNELLEDPRASDRKRLDAALVEAAIGDSVAAIDALLARGADPNARDGYGCALAKLAGPEPALDAVERLLAAGADPNGPSVNGQVVLHDAVEGGSVALVRRLLAAGADPNREDDVGLTPLANGCQEPGMTPELVDALIDGGADPNAGTSHSSALIWAIEARNFPVVERLVARGADVNARSEYLGRTPLHVAFEAGADEICRVLVRAGARRDVADERGIRLDDVFGPDGEDVRLVEVHYVPTTEPQQLRVEVEFAVLNSAVGAGSPSFSADAWAGCLGAGMAGGGRFAPESTAVEAVRSLQLGEPDARGRAKGRLELAVAGLAPEAIGWIARAVASGAVAYTGAGLHASLRGVAVKVRGSAAGASAIHSDELRAWLAAPPRPGRWPEKAPFAVRFEPGAPGIALATRKPASAKVRGQVEDKVRAWAELCALWPTAAPFPVFAVARDSGRNEVVVGIEAMGGDGLPFEHGPARDLLHAMLLAVHAKVPLEGAVVRGLG